MTKKMYGPIKKNNEDFENFETPRHTQKIDTPYFTSLKTILKTNFCIKQKFFVGRIIQKSFASHLTRSILFLLHQHYLKK